MRHAITIKRFLTRHIEGYLFQDLKTLSKIKLRKGQKIGGASYPMMQGILSGMECLGGILQQTTFSTDSKHNWFYFDNYWDHFFSISFTNYSTYGNAFKKLIRHGLAHTFLTKTGIWLTTDQPSNHLRIFTDNGNYYLVVDIMKFYLDFLESYKRNVRPIVWDGQQINGITKNVMQNRIDEMIMLYEKESNTILSKISQPISAPITLNTIISGASIVQGTVTTYSGVKINSHKP